jgi:N-carbamoyl-L-amino-acid hydrolase
MNASATNLRIDSDRLWDSLAAMAAIGPGLRGGNNRQTLTDADRDGRLLFQAWCEEAGCSVGIDAVGNMYARREGTDPDALPLMIGSHLDTQPTGGRYDGVLGVLAGLEIIRTLNDHDIATIRPIEIVNWTNEEGCRFAPIMLGSGVFAGMHSVEWAHDRTDGAGLRMGDELARIGFMGQEIPGARRPHAYLELHIEQGPILEDEGIDIGIVTHGQGLKWLQATLTGREAHTGSTPMGRRRNAGLGAARIVELVEAVAWSHAPHGVGAVGQLQIEPNARNVVPGKAVLTVDFRHPEAEAPARSGLASRSRRSAPSRRWPSIRRCSPACETPPQPLAIRSATSSPAPAMTPAGSTASRRPPWSSAPASVASATTKTRPSTPIGPRTEPMCSCTPPWHRPEQPADPP